MTCSEYNWQKPCKSLAVSLFHRHFSQIEIYGTLTAQQDLKTIMRVVITFVRSTLTEGTSHTIIEAQNLTFEVHQDDPPRAEQAQIPHGQVIPGSLTRL